MTRKDILTNSLGLAIVAGLIVGLLPAVQAAAQVPGGSVSPADIPKYVTPLVIPPVMNNDGTTDSYDIAVRQFKQQILPGGIWNTIPGPCMDNPGMCAYEATTVWSYGPAADPTPMVAPDPGSQFNYPAYTIETLSGFPVDVRWINDLVDAKGKFLPHLLPVDQTVHWANPVEECKDGTKRTDCAGVDQAHYKGPVPIVTHVHGAHVDGHSDGYPEAWWLPAGVPGKYADAGTLFDDATGTNPGDLGYADYSYRQDQPATTLWYHDHTLGMTRLNVYAGPAGFWLIREGDYDGGSVVSTGDPAVLPGPAPVADQGVLDLNLPSSTIRQGIREIPIVIQDRSFDMNGRQLFYPKQRAFFEGVEPKDLKIPYAPFSDVLPTWQPEAFFNVMVVNGVSWPELEVAPALYRLRLLNGCNSRFLWLKFDDSDVEVWQIGAEQGFLPAPVNMNALDLDGSGLASGLPPKGQVLMALAERADVIVDFRGLADGTTIELLNIGPDEPFGGGTPYAGCEDDETAPEECFEPADPGTTGRVMRFVVNSALNGQSPTDPVMNDGTTPNPDQATDPADLALNAEGGLDDSMIAATRQLSLNERESEVVCVLADEDTEEFVLPIKQVACTSIPPAGQIVVPFGPTEALLGTVVCIDDVTGEFSEFDPDAGCTAGSSIGGDALKWTDTSGTSTPVPVTMADGVTVKMINVTENPTAGDTEDWEIYNFTADAHPIHLHLVRFEVINREVIDGAVRFPEQWEDGYKDTVISYPGEITRIRAKFDVAGLYVWHCHIVEHEDNEMMRPYVVSAPSP